MPRRANYAVVTSGLDTLVIRDLGPWDQYLTVTNDVENVVKELRPHLNGRRLLYYDSEGNLDEIVVKDGEFAGFCPVSVLRP